MENKEKRDARKLSAQTKYELRKQVVRLKKKGMKGQEISELVGLGIVQISRIWQKYLKQGATVLKPQKPGRPIWKQPPSFRRARTGGPQDYRI